MSLQLFLLYLGTWSLVALTPGPAVLCAMSQATRHGFRASLAGIIGTQFGNVCFFVATSLGLAVLLKTAGTAFTILRFAGGAYLAYLGARLILSSFRHATTHAATAASASPARRSLFLQGLFIQLTNPKALLFVSALLPQFIEPHRPLVLQLVILLMITIAVDLAVLSAYARFAEQSARSLRRSGFPVWMERIFGTALVLFGVRLLLARK